MNELQTQPTNLIAQAIDKGADIATLEKLMDLQERFEANKARKLFFEEFTAFQAECPDLRKTKKVSFELKTGGNTSYNYAPLADITRQISKTLKDPSLSYRWEIQDDGNNIKVTCLISHVDGHTERTTMQGIADTSGSKNPMQARGSAVEYLKRYTLIGALGISTADSDIDGRLPELDIDKLHKQYMQLYDQICEKDKGFISIGNPDNWAAERTPQLYVKAIGKARETLSNLTKQKP